MDKVSATSPPIEWATASQALPGCDESGDRCLVESFPSGVLVAVVDPGIDWSGIETLGDLQTGLITALDTLGIRLAKQ